MKKPPTDRFESVWDSIADTREEAANLRVRSELMDKISELIAANGWTQVKAAAQSGLTQPRISDLLRGAFRGSRWMHWSTLPLRLGSGCTWSLRRRS